MDIKLRDFIFVFYLKNLNMKIGITFSGKLILLLFMISGPEALCQELKQTIKGSIIDKVSKAPLTGAAVYIPGSEPLKGTITGENGEFRLEEVTTGRIMICARYTGYEPLCVDNLNLTSGKELVLDLEMEETFTSIGEIVVEASSSKSSAINTMSMISARTFSIEESQRYAGARNDVARMAVNYAGVAAGNDAMNEIIIRGNSPNGLLWQLEGVEISNPNHFGFMGSTAGPVGMLNNNTLRNSDFITSAFTAEYGNALSGVFDLRMREGNHDKHEFLGQVGFNGFEFGAEGPLARKKNASYLVNYRYSTLGFFKLLGISFGTGTALPEYQDISFKLSSDLAGGRISLFGLAGKSSIDLLYSERDSSGDDNFYENEGLDIYNSNRQGTAGLSYFRRLDKKTRGEIILAADGLQNKTRIDTVVANPFSTRLFQVTDFVTMNYSVSASISTKFNSRLSTRFGGEVRNTRFSLEQNTYLSRYASFFKFFDDKGSATLLRLYSQLNLKLMTGLSVIAGLHSMYFRLNDEFVIEPRAAFRYKPFEKHSFSIGYGNHSKILPIFVYFLRVDLNASDYIQPNRNLNMTRANHFVASWDWQVNQYTRVKVEGYYQHLYDAAVERDPGSFSMLNNNSFQFSLPDTMVNGGTGDNKGFEITVERFINKGFYYLVTTSIFDSRYKGSDGISRSTAFDGGYVFNGLAGKEFRLRSKNDKKKNFLCADVKLTAAGGQRYTPVNVGESVLQGKTVYDDTRAYTSKFRDYFRLDARVAFRSDRKRFSTETAIDIENLTNRANPLYMNFNPKTGKENFMYQLRIFPMAQFRVIF
jgi:hypothetical protein